MTERQETVRVLLADDHTLIRAGIRALLERLRNVAVVGEAGDGKEAVELVRNTKPDVVLMDIAMPGLNGLEAVEKIRREFPDTNVLMLSVFTDEEFVARALHVGASGYLVKGSIPSELEVALRAVARGETYLSPSVSKQVVRKYLDRVGGGSSLFELLTQRQPEILQLVGEGKSMKEIASYLDLSVKTVEKHKSELMDRLEIRDTAGLIRYAIRAKLVNPDQSAN